MNRRLALALAFVALTLQPAAAAPPARDLYAQALEGEQAVRAELESEVRSLDALRAARRVVAAYEEIVRLYPRSGYSDNALWQAGVLALDAFERFGQESDRDRGVRLLRAIASAYPTSSLIARVPARLAEAVEDGAPGIAGARRSVATIREIRRTVLPDLVRLTIELDGEIAFRDERIQNPERVFVDLTPARAAPELLNRTLRFESDADVVRQVRLGRHPDNTTRVVLDVAGIESYSVYPLYSPYRLVIDCVRRPAITPTAGGTPAPLEPRRTLNEPGSQLPDPSSLAAPSIAQVHDAGAPAAAPPPASAPAAPPPAAAEAPANAAAAPAVIAPVKPLNGGVSMARQLGLNVSRIVIDPGHGGHDPGAKGKGITEADLVLDVALRLEKLLEAVPGTEVILTRRTDEYVALKERTAIANRHGADLFLSIHANASPNRSTRGVETYFLNFASNLSAARLAARENAASGEAMGALPDFVKAIALNNKLAESRDFATHVQRAMLDKLREQTKAIRDLGVKQAPFVVLIGAAMPSVLAEISFLSNAQDLKLLKTAAYRQKIAEALYGGVRKYQISLNANAIAQRD
jgi:N-acetylmuramoyl-L-alanine amidase